MYNHKKKWDQFMATGKVNQELQELSPGKKIREKMKAHS
jgi:hypothetical protein